MDLAQQIAILAAGGFFLTGLLAGAWKYLAITRSPEARAPVYVDTAHRAALLYAFACLVIERFVVLSRLDPTVEVAAVLAQVAFFALAIISYVVHGVLGDTDNQFARPHRLGRRVLPPVALTAFMVALMVGEIGGFAVLLWGAVAALPH
jgi:hypothetical protein